MALPTLHPHPPRPPSRALLAALLVLALLLMTTALITYKYLPRTWRAATYLL